MGLAADAGWTTPIDSPYYPALPAHYRNVRLQYVFYRADPRAVGRLLPNPLEPDPDGLCVAVGIEVPFCSAYGAFNEAALELRCSFRGQVGWYCSHAWHDGPAGIAAGREIYGTPKFLADLEIRMVGRSMITRGAVGGVPVLRISSTLEQPVDPGEVPSTAPSWRLKLIPRADGPGPALKQLVDAAPATQDLVVHAAFRGDGRVSFEPSPQLDLTDLAPRRIESAYYLETSFAEGYGAIVHDYLAPEPSR